MPPTLTSCARVQWEQPPTLAAPPSGTGVGLAADLLAETSAPCAMEIRLQADEHTRWIEPPEAASHRLPLLGMRADRTYDVQITCTPERGAPLEHTTTWTTQPLPEPFPTFTAFAHDRARMAPGFTLLDASAPDEIDYVLILDEDLEVVWFQRKVPPHFLNVVMTSEGQLMGSVYPTISRMDLLGTVQRRWTPEAQNPEDVPIDHPLHHEAVPLPGGGVLGLTRRDLAVPAVPLTTDDPANTAPGEVVDDGVITLTEQGDVDRLFWLSDVLDTSRVGFDGLELGRDSDTAVDWAHANAAALDPRDGGTVVTLRHQDAVIKLDAQGALAWILGTPSGWQPPQRSALLEPLGPIQWPFHPHAAEITDNGTLLVFDNGNHRHTPYDPEPAPQPRYSQIAAYRVDEGAHTVQLLWTYRDTAVGELYSPTFGDADALLNGNVLGVFGRVVTVAGQSNVEAGRGTYAAHIVEFHPEQLETAALHLVLSSRRADLPGGWTTYRAERIEGLYPWEAACTVCSTQPPTR